MLGLSLLYVGIVLFTNGVTRLTGVERKSCAIINFFTAGVGIVVNIIHVVQGDYYAAATGMLFAFTYLYAALNHWNDLDGAPFGWFQLFVAINTIPCAWIDYCAGDPAMAAIWLAWGVLWFTGWIELALKKDLGKFVPWLAITEGIVTAWIPGFLLLRGLWNVW